MKSIEDIRNMSLDALEAIADDVSVKAPAGQNGRIEAALTAESVRKDNGARHGVYWAVSGALAVAAASLAVVLSLPAQPKDTFTDPMQAYAELEKTFNYISMKVEMGRSIVEDAEPVFEMTSNIIEKINR